MDENGVHQTEELGFGDIWYFPKGVAHTLQGLDDENEYLAVLDGGDVNKAGYLLKDSGRITCSCSTNS